MLDFIIQHRILIAQIIGSFGMIAVVIGMQQKQYDRIALCKMLNSFFGGVHYIFLGGYTGMVINFASIFANSVYWYRNKRNKSNVPFQILFGICFVVLALLSWDGPISLFVLVAKVLSSVALGVKNTRVIRALNAISSPCWLVYNVASKAYPSAASDSFVIISILIAMFRYDFHFKGKKQSTEDAVLPEGEGEQE